MGLAHAIIVNSQFTQRKFINNFPLITVSNRKYAKSLLNYNKKQIFGKHYPHVLYPAIIPSIGYVDDNDIHIEELQELLYNNQIQNKEHITTEKTKVITCINRYVSEKNTRLAIESFALYMEKHNDKQAILVIAGDYNDQIDDNVNCEKELHLLAKEKNIENNVIFMRWISEK